MAKQEQIAKIAVQLQTMAAQVAQLQLRVKGMSQSALAPTVAGTVIRLSRSVTQTRPTYVGTIRVVPELCIGCGLCTRIAPGTFSLDPFSGKANIINQAGSPEQAVRTALAHCPAGAIQYV